MWASTAGTMLVHAGMASCLCVHDRVCMCVCVCVCARARVRIACFRQSPCTCGHKCACRNGPGACSCVIAHGGRLADGAGETRFACSSIPSAIRTSRRKQRLASAFAQPLSSPAPASALPVAPDARAARIGGGGGAGQTGRGSRGSSRRRLVRGRWGSEFGRRGRKLSLLAVNGPTLARV